MENINVVSSRNSLDYTLKNCYSGEVFYGGLRNNPYFDYPDFFFFYYSITYIEKILKEKHKSTILICFYKPIPSLGEEELTEKEKTELHSQGIDYVITDDFEINIRKILAMPPRRLCQSL